jgi:hypothetical protein
VCDIFAEIYLFRSPKARFGLLVHFEDFWKPRRKHMQ